MTKLTYSFAILVLIPLACSQLVLKNITKFPLSLGKPFEINVSINPNAITMLELMIIQTTDLSGFDKDIAIFDFGLKDVIDQEFQSEYMKIPIWGKTEQKKTIYAMINFTKFANNRILEIFYLNPNSTKERRMMLSDFRSDQRIYRTNIDLLVPPQIELKVDSKIGSEVTVKPNSLLVVSCQTFDGRPKIQPKIMTNNLKVESSSFDSQSNLQRVNVRISINDHNRTLICKAGNIIKSVTIFVYHAPTKVLLEPEVGKVLGNNTGVICSALNGYPIPRITWNFIDGPTNATFYYLISPYNQRLHIKENAPIGSRWKFICSATYSNFDRPETLNKTISFTVIYKERNKTESLFNININAVQIKNNIWKSDQDMLKILEEIKLEIFLRDITIQNLKDSISMQKLAIFQLNQTIIKLQEKQDETNNDMKILNKTFHVENKKLAGQLQTIKLLLKDQNKQIQTNKPTQLVITTKAPISPRFIFSYRIIGVSRNRRKRKQLRSNKFINNHMRFPIMLFISFRRMESLLITAHMSQINDADSSIIVKGYLTVTIFNAEDLKRKISIVKFFERGRRSANVEFAFNYFDLYQNQVLLSDDIIIKCALSFEK